ncbi:MAG: superoxide dismutase, partial [bacterium]
NLPYDYEALNVISDKTLHFHHDKHHQKYLDNFNKAIEDEKITEETIIDFFKNMSKYSTFAKNNGGGFWNHNFYFENITLEGKKPSEFMSEIIADNFASLEEFEKEFKEKAMKLFGSGWTWLVINNGKLEIVNTANQDNPYMDNVETAGIPILTMDMWEHAYYLDYQNDKGTYIDQFLKIINWEIVEERYKKNI